MDFRGINDLTDNEDFFHLTTFALMEKKVFHPWVIHFIKCSDEDFFLDLDSQAAIGFVFNLIWPTISNVTERESVQS